MVEIKLTQAKKRNKEDIEKTLNPLVKEWFFSGFKEFSETQLYGVMPIYERKNILISAPTGGTKTLTAFLSILNYLVELASKNELEDKIYCVYCSPLRALSNDIFFNLVTPLNEIEEIAKKKAIKLQKIRVGLRTGDTSTADRAKMAKQGVHILVTTPESLGIILASKNFVEKLKAVEFIIIDEIHALANKRGVHLSLSLEILNSISIIFPVRIGLSATIEPIEEIAKFLTGNRDCLIASVDFGKKLDIKIISPIRIEEVEGREVHTELYALLDKLIEEHKTTLIFTNTRSATERVIHHLKEIFPEKYVENIGAHHSSLSKEHRFNLEERLRKGELKVICCSTSLELGIDIGYIDLVILLGSPKSIARAIQRCGRSGHKLHDIAKGRFIVLDKDDLVECSVMLKQIKERKIDRVQIPRNCLDVLSQQIYAMAIYKIWGVEEMLALIKQSYCYSSLNKEDFFSVISYLSGEYGLENSHVYAKIWYDAETKQIGKRGKLARVIYMTNIGTIPEESFINVVLAPSGSEKVGMIDEGFLGRLKKGDVFVLGGSRYMYLYSRGMKAYVKGSINRPPTIPSWFSEMLPLSFDLACEISRFRKLISEKIKAKKSPQEVKEFIMSWCYVGENEAEEIYDYMLKQERYIGIPNEKELLVEEYRGEKRMFIFHSLYGRRINDALSRALGFCVARLVGRDIEIGINDNGFFFSGEKVDQEKIKKAVNFLNSKNIEEVLKEAVDKTEILNRRFRHCAARALMILRSYKGRQKSVGKQQVSSHFLLASVKKISKEFPILREARREVLEDLMDIDNAKLVLDWIKDGKVKLKFVETDIPSPFSLNLVMQGYSDLIKIEDKIEFLKRMYLEIQKRIEGN